MPDAVALFAARLILGVAWFGWMFASPKKKVVAPYFRILMLLLLGLAVVFGLTAGKQGLWIAGLIGGPAFVGSVVWLLEKRRVGGFLFLWCAIAALVWLGWAVGALESERLPERIVLALSYVASAATLGTAMCGMLLGHRYLTAPGMPLEPLGQANDALGLATIFRLLVSLAGLVLGLGALSGSTFIVWLALRWLAGIIGPLAVWYMVRRILVYRNTQSATGVLFVGVILTFIGELTADVLMRSVGAAF